MQLGMPLLVSVLLLARLMSPRMHLPRVLTASINNRTRGTMKKLIAAIAITLALISSAFAGEKYPLTMTAIYTKGHNRPYEQQEKHDYTSGDYECTKGDEHNAPDCRTSVEWAELERIGGTPDMVLFTMADGVQIGVQSVSVNKVYEITCSPGVSIIFCDVYYKLMEMTQANV